MTPRTFGSLGVIKIQTYCGTQCNTRSATVSFDLNNSKRCKSSWGHKFLPIDSRGDHGDRRGAVAAIEAEPGRCWPVFKASLRSSIHPPPTLARGQPRKSVLALLVRSRRLHGHAPWPRSGARRRLWRQKLRDNLRFLWLDHRVLCLFHLPWPWGQWEKPP